MSRFNPRTYALLAICLIAKSTICLSQTDTSSIELVTAAQIRALSAAAAAKRIPIRLRGCFMAKEVLSFAMQDETDSLFVFTDTDLTQGLEHGDLIEVIGVTNPGDYAPCATATSVRKIGEIEPPQPIRTSIDALYTGQMDAQWVEIAGIVRSVESTHDNGSAPAAVSPEPIRQVDWGSRLTLADGDTQLVVELREELDPQKYVDAKVRIVGHCFYLHNGNRQFVRPILHVPEKLIPEIIQPPSRSDFGGELIPISSLFTFDPADSKAGHRVHVRGVVTHHRPGLAVWLKDGEQSLRIESPQTLELQPGDLVDVLGFPDLGTYSPVLSDSVFKKIGQKEPPTPVKLDSIWELSRHDSNLVTFEAHLSEVQHYSDKIELLLQGLDTTVRGTLLNGQNRIHRLNWEPGSKVIISGIAAVGEGEVLPFNGVWWPESLHLLLRSPSDLVILENAPWWTAERISWALAAFLAVAIGTIGIVMLASRRRLKEQDQRRAMAESEFSAILNERNRVAREIHDTLSQNIGAISVQLELVRTGTDQFGDSTRKHLRTAHNLARTALADARDSIWNMRSQVLEKYDLGEALERIAEQMTEDTGIVATIEVAGLRRRLPPVVENNLLRIGQEAVTNAWKHAKPSRIDVRIIYRRRQIELIVEDDGIGFDVEKVSPETKRSFGLVGIRERADLLVGEVDIKSRPGKGTRIHVTVKV